MYVIIPFSTKMRHISQYIYGGADYRLYYLIVYTKNNIFLYKFIIQTLEIKSLTECMTLNKIPRRRLVNYIKIIKALCVQFL